MPVHASDRKALDTTAARCSRVDLAAASVLPVDVETGSAWPLRTRTQQLDGLLFTPRTICTSPDEFPVTAFPVRATAAIGNKQQSPRHGPSNSLPDVPSSLGVLAVSRLNLPQFLPPPGSSLDSVSYRNDIKIRVKPLDLTAVHPPTERSSAATGLKADAASAHPTNSGSDRSTILLPAIASSNLPPSISALSLGISPSSSSATLPLQHSKRGNSQLGPSSSRTAVSHYNASPLQSSRIHNLPGHANLNAVVKDPWQYPVPDSSARSAHGSKLDILAGESWQSVATAASAHEQWVLRRPADHKGHEEEQWGLLSVHLPDGAASVSEQLLQQLPGELHEVAQFCHVSQGQHGDAITVSMGGNPSGRTQTLLLATWFSDLMQQCSTAAQTDSTEAARQAASLNVLQQLDTSSGALAELRNQLVQGAAEGGADLSAWARGLLHSGKSLTQRVLGLLGTAFGMLVHQVAMHCFERAGFMASLWNMLTALLGTKESSDGQDEGLGRQSTLSKEHIDRMVSALDATAEKTKQIQALQAQLQQAEDRALLYETMAHELEQESLMRDSQVDRQIKALEAAAAEQQCKLQEDLRFKDQQISELQAEMGDQQNMLQELASQLQVVTTDVKGLGRFVAEQMVPAVPEPQPHSQTGSHFVCVGLDPMSAADELVSDMAANLKTVVVRMLQATKTKYIPTDTTVVKASKAQLLTYVKQASMRKQEEIDSRRRASRDIQAAMDAAADAAQAKRLSTSAGPQTVAVTIVVSEPVVLNLQLRNTEQQEKEIASLQKELMQLQQQLQASNANLHATKQQLLVSQTSFTLEHQRTRHPESKLEGATSLLSTLSSVHVQTDMHQGDDSSVDMPRHKSLAVSIAEDSEAALATAEDSKAAVADPESAEEDMLTPLNPSRRSMAQSSSSLASPRTKRNSSSEQLDQTPGGASPWHKVPSSRLSAMASFGRLSTNSTEMRSSPLPVGKINQLQEAMASYPDIKPRSSEWCLKLIDALFKSKRTKDADSDRTGTPRVLFMDHVFAHLLMTYGTKSMVTEFAACLMVSAKRYKAQDLRIEIFEKFALGDWDLRILNGFLQADHILGEPSKVPCCDYPPTHAPVRFGSPWVCINKCIHAAEMVLGKRAAATSQGFAAKLVALAEPAEEQEVQKYYSDPGSLSDREAVSAAMAKSLLNGSFKKMSAIQFRKELCLELLRCEAILKERLLTIIKEFDMDKSGCISQRQLTSILEMFEGPVKDPSSIAKECAKIWKEAQALADSATSTVGTGPRLSSLTESGRLRVDISAVAKACRSCELARRFIRLHYTPPAPTDQSAQQEADMVKMMYVIVKRQWRQQESAMPTFFAMCGHKEGYLLDQAAQFKVEQDHQRKVQLFFSIMLALLEQQLLNLKEKCTPAALTADPSLDIEAQFGRVATAIRVLYGHKCLLQEDFSIMPQPADQLKTCNEHHLIQDRMAVFNEVRMNVEAYARQLIGQRCLPRLLRWQKHIHASVLQHRGT